MRKKKGIITSAKMTGTVTVAVHSHAFHPIYKKRFRKSKKFLADAVGIEDIQEGDTVVITECRPLSKCKHFRITEVVHRIPRVSEIQEEEGVEQAIHREKVAPPIQQKSKIGNRESVDEQRKGASDESEFRIPNSESLPSEGEQDSKNFNSSSEEA